MKSWNDKYPVVVVENGMNVTLKPSQELVVAGIVQVAPNGEVSAQEKNPRTTTQTTHVIY